MAGEKWEYTLSRSPVGTSCGAGCYSYSAGTVVQLTATADTVSTFAGWTGACSGTGACSVTIGQNQSVTADFESSGTPGPVTGIWVGSWTRPISGLCAFETSSLTWSLTQSGNSVSGTFKGVVIATDPSGLCPDFVGDTSSGKPGRRRDQREPLDNLYRGRHRVRRHHYGNHHQRNGRNVTRKGSIYSNSSMTQPV